MTEKLPPILAAEDETSDAMILKLAFQRANLPHPLVVVGNGQEAVDYLRGSGRHGDRSLYPLPGLIVLDLKMPRMNGFDVLEWLARQPECKEIPAVILSSSSDESDMRKARELGAREYFVKPHAFSDLIAIVQQLHTRWLANALDSSRDILVAKPLRF